MSADGFDADAKRIGDFFVEQAVGKVGEDFLLPFSERHFDASLIHPSDQHTIIGAPAMEVDHMRVVSVSSAERVRPSVGAVRS
jgi:hypothetical protein